MQIIVDNTVYASQPFVEECIRKQFENMGYTALLNGVVTEKEPYHTKEKKRGIIFRNTYHFCKYKVITKWSIEKVDLGKYIVIIQLPTEEFLGANFYEILIAGFQVLLGDTKDQITVVFKKVPNFQDHTTDDEPYDFYY